MNDNPKLIFFPFYVKDWEAATARMRPLERFFYFSMLIEQYRACKPVPESFCQRLTDEVRAYYGGTTDRIQESFDFVKENYFKKSEEGYSNDRAEVEIAKCYEKSSQARKNVMKRYERSTDEVRTNYGRSTDVEQTKNERSTNQIKDIENKYIKGASASSFVADAPETEKKSKRAEAVQMPEGCDPQHWADWKKARKAPLTQTAWKRFVAEADKAGITAVEAVRICAEKGWRGFEADWLKKDSQTASNGYSTIKRTPEEEAKAVAMAKEYWERREAEAQKQASSDPFDRAMKKDSEKEAEKQIEDALGGFGMIHNVRGRY
jgi:uncharacterized protein YdaU (DUF1376 family)